MQTNLVTKSYLQIRKPEYVYLQLEHTIKNPEAWLASFLQMQGYCLQHPKSLTRNRVPLHNWISLHKLAESRTNYNYFLATIKK